MPKPKPPDDPVQAIESYLAYVSWKSYTSLSFHQGRKQGLNEARAVVLGLINVNGNADGTRPEDPEKAIAEYHDFKALRDGQPKSADTLFFKGRLEGIRAGRHVVLGLLKANHHEPEDQEWIRASGDCVCSECGKEYRKHPSSHHHDSNGDPYLNVLCDGTYVKL